MYDVIDREMVRKLEEAAEVQPSTLRDIRVRQGLADNDNQPQ